ncbi:ferrochelatase [Ghiorsea bivora]|uniref:ferrochelatase n=1 Tax=Ghiorsea bivora TaxID=1485545 RepID=UPI00056E110F|nr:ferrochelatase [Ghiorsea bivora]
MQYSAAKGFKAEAEKKVGVLLVNLGTPDAPTPAALRSYLKQFLGDPRVVEANRLIWWFALNVIILNIRPKKSAHAYQTVWTDEGSPLMVISEQQQKALQAKFTGDEVVIELAMTYGNPAIAQGLNNLREQGCNRLLILPLYPQYSGSTTAAVTDQVFDVLGSWRRVPDVRVLSAYHDEPAYIDALAHSVREHWGKHGKAEKLMMSFHGIPKRYVNNGDPYQLHCEKTSKLLADALALKDDEWMLTFQSIFGREEWLQPYTASQLKTWGAVGIKDVDVICPGFAADCLETLEEITVENKGYFIEAGGKDLRYIAALNDRDDHITALEGLIKRECVGWL